MKPRVVLVHGAYAESASWNGVIRRLQAAGHRVVAAANPLRSLSGDAAYLASLLQSIDGPIVLAGHSYGGMVASNAAVGIDQSKYPEYFAPDLPVERAAVDAAGQRPVKSNALEEPSDEPAWKTVPSWFLYGELDRAIPTELSRFMAERANARDAIEVPGASHALPASQPQAVADLILRAAATV